MKTLARIAWVLSIVMRIFFIVIIVDSFKVMYDLFFDYGIMGIFAYIGIITALAFHFFLIFPKKLRQIIRPESMQDDAYINYLFPKPSPSICAAIVLIAIFFAIFLSFYSYSWLCTNYDLSDEYIPIDKNYETEPELWMDINDTVYVSNTGKIHLSPDCSGMKNYDEMIYEEACEAGYEHCSRCFN